MLKTAEKWVHFQQSTPQKPIAAVAVVVKNMQHTGVIYQDDEDVLRFLHLASHCDLRRDKLKPTGTGWVLPSKELLPERLAHVAAMCERIWERNEKRDIPYGFRYNRSRFLRDGAIELGEDERGFTCATFVLAVFRAVGIELLQLDEWQKGRIGDQERFDLILAALAEVCEDVEHLEAIRKERDSARYRPLEVAGGSHYQSPASFEQASKAATEIEAELQRSIKL
jgi:hypothetical protein